MYRKLGKRLFDLLVAIPAAIVLFPLFLVLSLLVFIKLGSPVIFSQQRPGKNGKIFKMYKFRSMNNKTDENGNLLPDEKRLTSFGKTLRSTSLDEMPEIINIIKGDMSLVGPRPLLVKYLPLYSKEQARRHEVRPGLTGLAQINGRNAISWQDKFKYDVEYVDNLSFLTDIKIFFKTVLKVLKRDGINSGSSATMEEFKGDE